MPATTLYRRPVRTQGKNKYIWMPAVGDASAVTVAETTQTGAFEIQCATDGIDLSGAISHQTTDGVALDCDTVVPSEPAPTKLGTFQLHIFEKPQEADAFYAATPPDSQGWLACRAGLPHGEDVEAGQMLRYVAHVQFVGGKIPGGTDGGTSTYSYTRTCLLLEDLEYDVVVSA